MQISNPLDANSLYQHYETPSHWKNQPHVDSEISLISEMLQNRKNVLEIGCNDGTFLKNIQQQLNFSFALGIEPTKNTAKLAKDDGLNVLNTYFTYKLSQKLKEEYGAFSCIYSRQVFEHVSEVDDFLEGIYNLMDDNSLLMIEVPTCLSNIKKADISFI